MQKVSCKYVMDIKFKHILLKHPKIVLSLL